MILLYKTVHIDTFQCLRLFQKCIAASPLSNKRETLLGHLVEHLEISNFYVVEDSPEEDSDGELTRISEFMASLGLILLYVPLLQHFKIDLTDSWYCISIHIAILSRTAATTCTSMTLTIRREEDGVFPHINALTNLRDLTITVEHISIDRLDFKWAHKLDDAIILRSIKFFNWIVEGAVDLQQVKFVALCRFGAQCSIRLQMENLASGVAADLKPLFAQNTIAKLELDNFKTSSQSVLAEAISRVPCVVISGTSPTRALARQTQWPSSITVDHGENGDKLWTFLLELQDIFAAYTRTRSHKLYIRWGSNIFSWLGGHNSNDYALFVGKLFPVAINLAKKNISIVDCQGVDCTTFATFVK
jgi:hypothetical protein